MAGEDAEDFLRALAAPLKAARRGEPLPGTPFGREAVANAFVMLGLLPEPLAEEILSDYKPGLEAEGFRIGTLTGELSVRPGAYGFQDARAGGRDELTRIPLAAAAGPVPLALDGVDVRVTWVTLTPGGARLGFRATGQPDENLMPGSRRRGGRGPGLWLRDVVLSGLSVTDDRSRRYRVQPVNGHGSGPRWSGPQAPWWEGEILAEPEPRPAASDAGVRWLELAIGSGRPARVVMSPPADLVTGVADPPWPTPAESYLAALAGVTSSSINGVELDVAQIVAEVADALLSVGALPPGSALLAGSASSGGGSPGGWQESLAHLWGRHAWQRARDGEPDRAGLAAGLPLRQATAVIESITAHDDLVWIQLYGHPWVTGEYWPMITPCFQVRATDDTGAGHEGMAGSGGGWPEGSQEFWFWPPIAPAAKRIRVTVSTLWEAAWADVEIPGRTGSD